MSRTTAAGWFFAVALALGLCIAALPSCSAPSSRRSVHRVKTEPSKKPRRRSHRRPRHARHIHQHPHPHGGDSHHHHPHPHPHLDGPDGHHHPY